VEVALLTLVGEQMARLQLARQDQPHLKVAVGVVARLLHQAPELLEVLVGQD
jgi:hypothetical protein